MACDTEMDPDSKFHGANMGPTWVLSAPDGPNVVPVNFAIWGLVTSTLDQRNEDIKSTEGWR